MKAHKLNKKLWLLLW